MDIWDWLKGLRRWWWMLVVFPLLAAGITWFVSPTPVYESRWTSVIYFDDPQLANNAGYVDFILLDDMHLLLDTGVLGDVLYLRLPEGLSQEISRQEFGEMFSSTRHANFVEIEVSGDNADHVRAVSATVHDNMEEMVNLYLIPPDYRNGAATVETVDPISEPALNSQDRIKNVGAISAATFIAAIAATGVAEWLRMSYRAKNGSK